MPLVNKQGLSEYTEIKEKIFYNMIKQNVATVNVIHKKNNWGDSFYTYIDATSGSGWNESNKGSPLQFWDAINSMKSPLDIKIKAFFIEEKKEIFDDLKDNLSPKSLRNTTLMKGKYQDCIPSILKNESCRFGILYIDPNGVIDFDFLEDIVKSRYLKFMDVVLYCGATSVKRKRKAFNNIKELAGYIRTMNKKKWFVSDYWGKQQWAFFYGTNSVKYKPYSNGIKFYDISSSFGDRIFRKLNFTNEEYQCNLPGQRSLDEICNERLDKSKKEGINNDP